ncbi:MAG: tRNA (adenosine(37)-N6)-dimethylallyltransferase MiaA [Bacteroidaceae bacterium]|nr:tRNA (adenosine(37)-N6)-dimethylallyltransferase MiaA [Bacteroidaceae bacterium]MBQ3622837.1 tRNA (adenosine(37)-N6)-dimethylallyltransferase MiaA [Bacteroidaceae bacterium]
MKFTLPSRYDMLAVVGPTACGKTSLAVELALALHGEVLSADSRQVYRGMDIGTGKDLNEYMRDGVAVPVHMVDIVDAGEKYNLFEFQRDFLHAYEKIRSKGSLPIMCGGSGMYVESVLRGYRLIPVPENTALRNELANKTLDELTAILATYKKLHNNTDTDTVKRAIRAIEIEEYYKKIPVGEREFPKIRTLTVGLDVSREVRRERISRRLHARMEQGLVEEVERLLASGLTAEQLIYYGLEYKFVTLYIKGELTRKQMIDELEIAIHQFAKRQMTWFRGMERRGIDVKWVDTTLPMSSQVEIIKQWLYDKGAE